MKAYHDAGQFYWQTKKAVANQISALTKDAIPFIIPRNRVQDIDEMEDWDIAEKIMKNLNLL